MAKRKSYNPFKMVLPYMGAILGLIYAFVGFFFESGGYDTPLRGGRVVGFEMLLVYLFSIIIGFLIGWGINSLYRIIKN